MEKAKSVVKLRPMFRGQLVNELTEQRAFMDKLSKRLKLSSLEDWYKVKQNELVSKLEYSLLVNFRKWRTCDNSTIQFKFIRSSA